ncbi:MAG: hypothetical protein NZO58_10365 [Gemmataceae bacterium]|nr:hypothetical protein [Gemmataceae bacterium]
MKKLLSLMVCFGLALGVTGIVGCSDGSTKKADTKKAEEKKNEEKRGS